MKLVKLIKAKNVAGPYGAASKIGSVLNLPDNQADALIEAKIAVEVKAKSQKEPNLEKAIAEPDKEEATALPQKKDKKGK